MKRFAQAYVYVDGRKGEAQTDVFWTRAEDIEIAKDNSHNFFSRRSGVIRVYDLHEVTNK